MHGIDNHIRRTTPRPSHRVFCGAAIAAPSSAYINNVKKTKL